MLVKDNKESCSGCSACCSVCSVNAITMQADNEGFLYPSIDKEKCINCNMCVKVCPFDEDYCSKTLTYKDGSPESESVREYWVVKCSDEGCQHSRSGGAFYAAAQAVIKKAGTVYGVSLTDSLKAVFERVESVDNLSRLQGSKYVQAEKADCYKNVEDDLKKGRAVLFAGTSCEVAGLKSYLRVRNVDTTSLYTIDIICHGVPSPKLWADNVTYLEDRWKCKIVDALFRDKSLGWKSHIESYILCNGKKKYANRYTTLFYSGTMLRPSCYNCKYSNFDRIGDITIGDFWGALRSTDESYRKYAGYTQLMVNSLKGKSLFSNMECEDVIQINRELFSYQPNLFAPTEVSINRARFWELYNEKGYYQSSNKEYTFLARIKIIYNRIKNIRKR